MNENKIKANHFSLYFSYRIFKDFIEKNEFADSVRMKYIRLYKKQFGQKEYCFMAFYLLYCFL